MQTAAEYVQINGLEALRGMPLQDGSGKVVYVSDTALDAAISLWSDEQDDAFRKRMESKSRLYGAETRNANMVSWIYLKNITVNSMSHCADKTKFFVIGKPGDYPASADNPNLVFMDPEKFDGEDDFCTEYAVRYSRETWGDLCTSYHTNFAYELAIPKYRAYMAKRNMPKGMHEEAI